MGHLEVVDKACSIAMPGEPSLLAHRHDEDVEDQAFGSCAEESKRAASKHRPRLRMDEHDRDVCLVAEDQVVQVGS